MTIYARRILFESPHLRVVYQPAASDVIVFSFNGLRYRERGLKYFGDSFLATRGYAGLGIVQTSMSWYPQAHMRDALAAIEAELPRDAYRTRIGYGVSMGAYAALKYGRRLGLDAVLAFAPQASIDPAVVGAFETSFTIMFRPALHTGMQVVAADLAPRNFVFFDPRHPPDVGHFALLPQGQGMAAVAAPFTGHPGVGFYTQTNLIEPFIPLAARPETPARAFRTLIRAARTRSSRYWVGRAQALRDKQRASLLQLIVQSYRQAIEIETAQAADRDHGPAAGLIAARTGLAEVLLDDGRNNEAQTQIELLRRAHASGAEVPDLLPLLLRGGRFRQARVMLQDGARITAVRPLPYLEFARRLLARQDLDGAHAAVAVARNCVGADRTALRLLLAVCERLGRQDDVTKVRRRLNALRRAAGGDAAVQAAS